MKLTEPEMRMAYQLESTSQEGVLNELYMTCRYSRDEDTKYQILYAECRCGARTKVYGKYDKNF